MFKTGIQIGITGASRVGKSTLINTIRGLKSKDRGAALIKHGVECTSEATPYLANPTNFERSYK